MTTTDFTIATQWKEFSARHFDGLPSVPEVQFIETRKTFYATWAQCLLFAKNEIAPLSDDDGVKILQDQLDEILKFMRREVEFYQRAASQETSP